MDEKRDIVSKSILLASLRLTHDHELGFYELEDLLHIMNIDYTNELVRIALLKINGMPVDKELNLYLTNKDIIIKNRLRRVKQKKERINERKEEDWISAEEEYRNEEIEHLKILLDFIPNNDVSNLKRANYNDIRLMRNYIRTVNNCNGILHDDNKINKYRNLELTINNNDYIVIEVVEKDNINFGYIINKRNWLDKKIIKILDSKFNIEFIDNDNELLKLFLDKIQ